MNALALSLTWNFGSFFNELLPSLPYFLPSFCVYASLKHTSLFATSKIYDMLVLSLKTAKVSEHTLLSANHGNSDISYLQWTYNVMTKNNGQSENRDKVSN